jgi:hypothetical protein
MIPLPQFAAEIEFHFREHSAERRHWFMFDESLHRRVPMRMDGIDGLNTVGMWIEQAGIFKSGDVIFVRCVVLAPELFSPVVKPGVKFELWDSGFIASGIVRERFQTGW